MPRPIRLILAFGVVVGMCLLVGCSTSSRNSGKSIQTGVAVPSGSTSAAVWDQERLSSLTHSLEASEATITRVSQQPADLGGLAVNVRWFGKGEPPPRDPFRVLNEVVKTDSSKVAQVTFTCIREDGTVDVTRYLLAEGRIEKYYGRRSSTVQSMSTVHLRGTVSGMTSEVFSDVAEGRVPPPVFR